ncbi:MAG TPA: outer membrane protein assembly factor BamA, partial [Candidatus Saccharimonadales bacterium]|nr:outer membrane protein assembly factor BamA [Candidatus Saccharimonadales bacterium]
MRQLIRNSTRHHAAIGLSLALAAVTFLDPGVALAQPGASDSLGISVPSLGDTTEAVGPAPIIRSVAAQGFVNTDSLVVVRTFAVTAGQPYDPRETRAGVRRLFATGLFTDVTVSDAPAAGGGIALTIHVTERPRIKEIDYRGVKKLETKTLKEKLTSAEGQLLDPGTLELDARKIEQAYAAEGYAHARALPRSEVAGAGAVKVVFDVQEGTKVKVRGIVFHGVQTLNAEKLSKAMESKTPGFLKSGVHKPEHIEKDETKLRLYMRTRGYKDADVDSIVPVDLPDGKGVTLHVFLREGPRYRFGDLAWTGNTAVPTSALTIATVPKSGAIYNEAQIQKTLENAYQLYQEQGYLFLSIEPKMADRDSIVDVAFQIQEGNRSRIANLAITGNTRTRENVIRREASVYPGDIFRRSTLMRTQRDIFGLGFFQDVNVDYEPTGDSSDINLTLKVQEKQTGTASAGAGYSSQSGLTGFVELGHNNLFGKGQSVNIRLERGSKRNDLELSYTEPWFRDTPLTIGGDIFNTSRDLDFYSR